MRPGLRPLDNWLLRSSPSPHLSSSSRLPDTSPSICRPKNPSKSSPLPRPSITLPSPTPPPCPLDEPESFTSNTSSVGPPSPFRSSPTDDSVSSPSPSPQSSPRLEQTRPYLHHQISQADCEVSQVQVAQVQVSPKVENSRPPLQHKISQADCEVSEFYLLSRPEVFLNSTSIAQHPQSHLDLA